MKALLTALSLAGICSVSSAAESTSTTLHATPSEWQRFEFHSKQELDALFDKQRFGPKYWAQGERTVPRIYVGDIPEGWGKKTAPSLTVQEKKRTFIWLLGPTVLAANERVAAERHELDLLVALRQEGAAWDTAQQQWLQGLATRYSLHGNIDNAATLDELKARVDIVPVSLVLAQAATESGWGTSRFAAQGNALFGQWTYGGDGIMPKEQRTAAKGNYRIRAFETPLDSVSAYLLNINTHRTYADLRQYRSQMRKAGKPLSGEAMASGLLNYSERGQAYVNELRALIRRNHLAEADAAALRDMTPIVLVPINKGAN